MLGKTVLSTALSAVVAGAFMMGAARADVPESSEPIKIVTNNWTSQLVLAHVVGDLLMDMG